MRETSGLWNGWPEKNWLRMEVQNPPQVSCVFFGCVGPIHYKTCLREAYASLRGVKGKLTRRCFVWSCLRGWLRKDYFVSKSEEVSFEATLAIVPLLGLLWLHFLLFWLFVASFPFILAFCGFIVPSTKVFGREFCTLLWLLTIDP